MRGLIGCVVKPSKNALIVDYGCGTGANLASLAQDYQCLGMDPSLEAIELAKARFPGISFVVGNSPGSLNSGWDRVKAALLMDVLEHVADDAGLLAGIVQHLSPGAYLLITVPADPSLFAQHDVTFGHYRRYEQSGFERLWSGLPVRPLLLSYYNSYLYLAAKAVREMDRWRGKVWGEGCTDFSIPAAPVNYLLEEIFVAESRILTGILMGKRSQGFRRGVSLIAVLQRR